MQKRIIFLSAIVLFVAITSLFVIVICGKQTQTVTLDANNNAKVWDSDHPDGSISTHNFSVKIPILNNAKVEYSEDTCALEVNGKSLLTGYCTSFYLSDLTGDGNPELCFGTNVGYGITVERIDIFDYQTLEPIFQLSDDLAHDYRLFLRDGNLCIIETVYRTDNVTRTGMLVYNNHKVTVLWDENIDYSAD